MDGSGESALTEKREVRGREIDLVADPGYASLLAEIRQEVRAARLGGAGVLQAQP